MVPSILGMTGALARRGEPIQIVTPTPSRLDGTLIPDRVQLLGPETDLDRSIRSAEVVHFHGLWQGHTRLGCRTARLADVPYLVAAHGMAEPWALRHKAFKKKVYTALVEGRNLRRASCLHALARPEISHLRAIAPKTPIALVPNGVELRPFDNLPPRSELEAEFPELKGKFIVLFYGRLHLKKGLQLLADALESVARDHPEVHILLAGNDDGALTPFLERTRANGLTDRVTVLGHVSGERGRKVWAAANAFALPSFSEGFSMAILEALACRLPVLVTTACHFPELTRAEGGIVVEPTSEGVTGGLRDLLDRSDTDREQLAHRGRDLVERQYTWDRQADRLASVYRWVAGGGPVPDAVEEARGL
ncbi:glycosyltransferase [Tundrisphaera lichenicola]|uniref:glycosyltransferase n=1 Tax=Tundrisphaera lichenicola TaxID=2029860 RepID=UPI003EBFF682